MEPLKLVARFLDGAIRKGTTHNFSPAARTFHMKPVDANPGTEPDQIDVDQLKALYFVRSFEGKPDYNERRHFEPADRRSGRKVQVIFNDGEEMAGSVIDSDPHNVGFFLFPTDPQSNNQRVFVVNKAVKKLSNV